MGSVERGSDCGDGSVGRLRRQEKLGLGYDNDRGAGIFGDGAHCRGARVGGGNEIGTSNLERERLLVKGLGGIRVVMGVGARCTVVEGGSRRSTLTSPR